MQHHQELEFFFVRERLFTRYCLIKKHTGLLVRTNVQIPTLQRNVYIIG